MLKTYSTMILHSLALFLFLLCFYFILGAEAVSLFFLFGGALLSIAFGLFLSRLKGTLLTTILAGVFIPPTIHFLVAGVELLLSLFYPQWDSLLISFDSNMALFSIPLFLAYLLSFTAFRFPRIIPFNTAFLGILLLIISTKKKNIDLLFTDREFFLIQLLFGVLLFVICALLLILSDSSKKSSSVSSQASPPNPSSLNDPSKKKKRPIIEFKRIALFLFITCIFLFGSFLLLTKLYTSNSLGSGGGLMRSDLFRFDFSDLLSLESKIEMSDDLILLFRKEGFAENYKIRRFVLNGYSPKKGFYRDPRGEGDKPDSKPQSPLLPDSPTKLYDPDFQGRLAINQEYYLLNINPSSFLSLNYPISVIPYKNWPESSFTKVFKVVSKVPDDLALLDLAWIDEGDYILENEFLSYYTDYGEDLKFAKLAQEIVGDESSLFAQAKLIENYLKNNYFYSLQPGLSPDGDQLSYFLFEGKKGYCSYFAFAMTLLCRSVGLPTRIAVGFSIFPENELLNFYPVLGNQAHAWVEVYFDEYGWIDFDPTSQNIAPGEEIRFGQADTEEFISLIEEILRNRYNLNPEIENAPSEEKGSLSGKAILTFLKTNRFKFLLILVAALLLFYSFLRFRFLLFFVLCNHPRKKAKFYYQYATTLVLRLGFNRKKGETPLAVAIRCDALKDIKLSPLAKIYLKALFGESFSSDDYTSFIKEKTTFLSSLKRLPLKKRLLLLFNPIVPIRRSF